MRYLLIASFIFLSACEQPTKDGGRLINTPGGQMMVLEEFQKYCQKYTTPDGQRPRECGGTE